MSPFIPHQDLHRRLIVAATILIGVVLIGSAGYYLIGDGSWTLFECLFMTVITLSTVGYGETLSGMDRSLFARNWTVFLIVMGSGTLLYFVSTFTAFLIEGDIQGAIRRNRMQKKIVKLKDHIIVAGAGATGIKVVEELLSTKTPFVVIEDHLDRLNRIMEEISTEILFVQGDATDDLILQQAGIASAKGLAATLRDDRDNVFVTITARSLNPALRIVAKVTEHSADAKLKRAGADATVSPSNIGGMRVISELIRPKVVRFLDQMLYDQESFMRIEEVRIPESSSLVGAKLKDTNIRSQTDVLVLAVRSPEGEFSYNPGPRFVLQAGMVLVVLAAVDDVIKLRNGIQKKEVGRISVPTGSTV